jgi:Photosynthetic reaction centre cytochrome C subunit
MRISRFTLATAVAVVSVSLVAGRALVFAAPAGQATQAAPATPPPAHEHPAPTNLKVLPKDMTGEQVHELMEKWEGELGTTCKTCHAIDPKNIGPNGKPRLNYADDSKDEKQTARKMYKMVEDINMNYISKIDSSGEPVSCGTCHRGHLGPESFVAPPTRPHEN